MGHKETLQEGNVSVFTVLVVTWLYKTCQTSLIVYFKGVDFVT